MNRRHWVVLQLIGALGLNLVAGFVLAHFISSSYIWGYVFLWAMLNVIGVVCVTRRSKTLNPQNHDLNTISAALDLAQQGQWGQVEGLVGSQITAQLAAKITPQGNHRGNGQPRGSSERKRQFVMSIERIQQSTQALEVVSSKTKELFNHLNRAGQLAGGAQSRVDQGQTVLSDNVEAMAAISTSFKRMKEVIGVIDGIAFKTNLLALNAAVEAARAGDAGLGFAVVAEEVRALARSAAQEAQKTQELIGSTLDRVIRGESLVKEARQAFQELSDTSVELGTIVSLVQSDSSALGHGLDRQNFEIMTSTARAKEMVRMSNGAAGGSPTICRFRPQWVPQSQFAGYYVAFEKGFFEEEGVQIEMLDGGPDTNPMSELLRGEIEFGTTWMAPSLIMASQGADLVLLSQVFHRNGLLLVTLKEKGFETIDNLKGCNIGVWGGEFNYPVQALDRERGLGFVYVQQGFDMSELLEGKVDAALSMGFNEMFSFDDKGVDRSKLKIFRFEDLGLKLPEDGIYTTRRFLNKNPQACAAFINASLKGWQYAMANPREAVEMVMAHAARSPFPSTREHQQRMLEEILGMVKDSLQTRGNLNEIDFQNAQETLTAIGQIDQKVDYEKFFHVGM